MTDRLKERLAAAMESRRKEGLERTVNPFHGESGLLNLADNDYFRLAGAKRLAEAAKQAVDRFGLSSSASPLITGFGPAHASLLDVLKRWHGFSEGMIWNTGYAANQALLSNLPQRGDVVLADRLIHNSMISGILASGARLMRYAHCDLKKLEALLQQFSSEDKQVFVVTESVFSMDGDYPDLAAMAELKERYGFFWLVDEAHALGWYGETGAGLAEASGCAEQIDALVGTLGKALGSMGAYTLFHDETIARYLVNHAGEFIYSTYLSPVQAAAAEAAVACLVEAKEERARAQGLSRRFRAALQAAGFAAQDGDSPIVPVVIGAAEETLRLAAALRQQGIVVGAIRPPTVPVGESRLRISLNANLEEGTLERVVACLREATAR